MQEIPYSWGGGDRKITISPIPQEIKKRLHLTGTTLSARLHLENETKHDVIVDGKFCTERI